MLKTVFKTLSRDERAATAIEYGLLLASMTVLLVGAVTLVGAGTASNFNEAAAGFDQ